MKPNPAITDHDRADFLRKLADSVRAKNGLILTPWEDGFLHDFLRAPRSVYWFTDRRRESTDKMWMKYGSETDVAMPIPAAESKPQPLPAADDGCCQFLIFDDDRRQVPCNAPAIWKRQNGFRYCDDHAKDVMKHLERRGRTMYLTRIS